MERSAVPPDSRPEASGFPNALGAFQAFGDMWARGSQVCLSQIRSAWLGTANRAMKLVHVGPAQPDQVVAP
jgi:hypothetical protein